MADRTTSSRTHVKSHPRQVAPTASRSNGKSFERRHSKRQHGHGSRNSGTAEQATKATTRTKQQQTTARQRHGTQATTAAAARHSKRQQHHDTTTDSSGKPKQQSGSITAAWQRQN
ncbi:hypothetical protein Ae201684P_007551 [Aphanomyces euteiches]|nr:hypothetical protein Ae201684P_007551 [Aphanomyces euteiches]